MIGSHQHLDEICRDLGLLAEDLEAFLSNRRNPLAADGKLVIRAL